MLIPLTVTGVSFREKASVSGNTATYTIYEPKGSSKNMLKNQNTESRQ